MDPQREPLETLKEIRTLMERSSRFLSLSGLSGVIAGITALAGIAAAYIYLDLSFDEPGYYNRIPENRESSPTSGFLFLAADFLIVLLVSILAAGLLARKKAKKEGLPVWDATAKRLVVNMAIPLVAGGLYVLILLYHGQLAFIAPATLIFYGLALLNASKYTLDDIRYLGIIEIATGLLAGFFIGYGLLFWAFGFGLVHIVYGSLMYLKYEK